MIYSISAGANSAIVFDGQQETELILTIAQAGIGFMFLINMELAWWEASALLALFLIPFASHSLAKPVTWLYVAWIAIELVRMLAGKRKPEAVTQFIHIWHKHIR